MAGWTLAELSGRVAQLLAAAGISAPNGRVTQVPDARVIRWYATVGLLDRPTARRGRTAIYGPRHLLQLVAIKRRQAQGFTLAAIQAELTGATDDTLRQVADLPDSALAGHAPPAAATRAPLAQRSAGRGRFWTQPTTAAATRPVEGGDAGVLHAVSIGSGTLLLLLPVPPGPDDLAAIRAAAQPLLDLLAARDLSGPPGATVDPTARDHPDGRPQPRRHDHGHDPDHRVEGARS